MHTVVVIGAGFSGSLAAVQLVRGVMGEAGGVGGGGAQPLRVILIEKSGAFGPGLAYGNGGEKLLLNVVAGRMSALPDDAGHFLRWAQSHDPSIKGEAFLPRRMFGRYIADLVETTARACPDTVRLERVVDEVVDVMPAARGGGGVLVTCRDAGPIRADAVVLALGNFAPPRPSWCDVALEASGRFIGDPWRGPVLEEVGAEERVLVVGTGLTMMDVVTSLDGAGHRGPIDAVSRRGLLSQAHRHGNPNLARLPDPLFSRTFTSVSELLAEVRRAVRHAEAGGGDWRDAVNALRPITPALWAALDDRERRRFLDHLVPFWNTHRHRAPPSVAEGIERLIDAGRLRVHAARITGAKVIGSEVEVRLAPRGRRPSHALRVDRIINCTGPTTDLGASAEPLVRALLARGMIRRGPVGMGVDFDDAGRVIDASGASVERVYMVGPARIGRFWEATAVPELRVQALEAARRVLEHLRTAMAAPRVQTAPAQVVSPQ